MRGLRAAAAIGLTLSLTLLLILGLTIGLPMGAPPAVAGNDDDVRRVGDALASVGDDLEAANAKVAKAVTSLNVAQARLPAAQRELAEAQREESAAISSRQKADGELQAATDAADAGDKERQDVEAQIADLQGRVGNLAREVYQNGAFADFDMLVTAESPTQLADRAAALDAVSRANNQTLAQMASVRADLALKLARLEILRNEVSQRKRVAEDAEVAAAAARSRAAAAKAEVDRLVAARKAALAVADKERDKVRRQYEALQAEQTRILAVIAAEQARLSGDLGFSPTGSGGFVWPLPGHGAGQGVGPRVHPVFGYQSCHSGVDIGAGFGTPIHSTAAGLVLANQSGGPYGNHTLIAHGDGVFSMYAHQSSFGMAVGTRVKAGEVIGYVGSTGYSTGPHLHFEIHIGNQPYNPMGWFGGSKGTRRLLMSRERGRKMIAQNRKARHEYHIEDTFEAGMVLVGTEVKSLRAGRASLVDAFAQFSGAELFLHGLHIPEYAQGTWTNHAPRRVRKLLLKHSELDRLERRTRDPGLTLVPLSLYFKDGYAKVELALGRGRKAHDKRQAMAERDARRDIAKELGRRVKRGQ